MFSLYAVPDAFGSGRAFAEAVEDYVEWLLSARPADPDRPVLVPGDPERITAAERRAGGLPLSSDAWDAIVTSVRATGMASGRIDALLANGAAGG
ncbi:MAG: Ldh family oxidoreductase [Alphaproteobacteria bacterium]|nr:Ldh family oxidoreductase [Alphaproteobacteria bacterium]